MTQLHLSAAFVERLGWVLVHSVWQFAFIALAALVLQRAMQRASAATRYWALLLALGTMLVAPVATWLAVPHEDRGAEMSAASNEGAGRPEQADGSGIPESDRDATPRLPVTTTPLSQQVESLQPDEQAPTLATYSFAGWWSWIQQGLRPWLTPLVIAWCVGVFLFAMRPLLSWYRIRRLRTVGVSAAPDAVQQLLEHTAKRLYLRHAVQVLQSTLVQTAVVVGYFRPVILLPMSVIAGLSPVQLEAVLAHELAHIRRHDYVVNLLQTLVETVFFYHPAVWWLSSQIRSEREDCCDDIAAAVLGSRVEYGRALLALEEHRGAETALTLGAQGGSLLARVRRLLGHVPAGRAFGGGTIVGVGLLAMAAIAVGVWAANGLGGSDSGTLAKEPAQVKKPAVIFKAPDSYTLDVALTADGKLLARAGADKTIDLWDVASGKKLHTLKGHTAPLLRVKFSPDGKSLASITGTWLPDDVRGEVKLWDVATGKERVSLKGHPNRMLALAFSPDGKTLATSSKTVKLWDVETGKEKMELRISALSALPWSLAFSPDGKTLATGTGGGFMDVMPSSVILWELTTGKKQATFPGHGNAITWVGFAPDGKTLASASGPGASAEGKRLPGEIKLWDVATAKERATIPFRLATPLQFFDLTFTPDNKSLISATASFGETENEGGHAVTQWELASGKARATFWAPFKIDGLPGAGTNAGVYFTALAADGKTVAWGGAEEQGKKITGTAYVWDVQSLATSPPKFPKQPKKPAAKKPLPEQAEGTFSLRMPVRATFVKPGERKKITLGIKRGKNFDEDVTLTFTDTDVPKGVTFDPATPVIKHPDTEATFTIQAANDAAVGDFAIKVTGLATKGLGYINQFNLSVDPAGAAAAREQPGKPETRRRYLRRSRDPFTGTFDFSIAADESAHDGEVLSIAGGKLVMKGKDGKERTYTLAANPQISYNNAACRFENLRPGMIVRVTAKKDNPQAATRIEAVNYYGAFMADHEERQERQHEKSSSPPANDAEDKVATKKSGEDKTSRMVTMGVIVLISAKTEGISEGAKIKQIDAPKESIGKRSISNAHVTKGRATESATAAQPRLNGTWVVKTCAITLADGKSLENREVLFGIDFPPQALKKLRFVETVQAESDQRVGTWYAYVAADCQIPVPEGWDAGVAQAKVYDAIKKLGGAVRFTEESPAGVEVSFSDAFATDAALKEMAALKQLRTLNLHFFDPASAGPIPVTDAGLKELKGHTSLKSLNLRRTKVTDKGLKELKQLQALQALILRETQITDAGLKELNALQTLQVLDLGVTRITDTGLKELTGLKDLQTLNVDGTGVTAAGIKELQAALPRLKMGAPIKTDAEVKAAEGKADLAITKLGGALVRADSHGNDDSIDPLATTKPDPRVTRDPKKRVVAVSFNDTTVKARDRKALTDAGLKELDLKELKHLRSLDLSRTQITDAGLKELKELRSLRELWLDNTKVTDAGLKELKDLKSLQGLRLCNTRVTGSALKELKSHSRLQTLALGHSPITDAGMKGLKELKSLQTLDLSETQITDAGLKELKDLKSLSWLDLSKTHLTDAGLKVLAGLESLQGLVLRETKVTDTGLKEFTELKTLHALYVDGTKVTAAGVKELQAALPKLKIEGGPGQKTERPQEKKQPLSSKATQPNDTEVMKPTPKNAPGSWVSLFNAKNLTGWVVEGDNPEAWRVEGGGLEVLSVKLDQLTDEPGAYPGLKRRKGHVGLGKGVGVARFRNIEIKELKPAEPKQKKASSSPPTHPSGTAVKEVNKPKPDADGWVSLFNGKDLSGWKTHPVAPGNWRVGDGILIGRGPKVSHLYTERSV